MSKTESPKCSDCGNPMGAEASIKRGYCQSCATNDRGGERAVCPECGKLADKMFYFDKEDTREMQCVYCKKYTYNGAFFPKSFQKAKEEHQRSLKS